MYIIKVKITIIIIYTYEILKKIKKNTYNSLNLSIEVGKKTIKQTKKVQTRTNIFVYYICKCLKKFKK